MNGNRNLSSAGYAAMRTGSISGPDFSFFKQQAGYRGVQKGTNLKAGSAAQLGSGPFLIESDTIKTGEVASIDKNRFGTVYGANSASANRPMTPLGDAGN